MTASRFLHVRTLKSKSRANRAIETLEVAHVLKNIRQTSWAVVSPFAKRCEIAPCVTDEWRDKITNVSSRSARIVKRTRK